MLKILFVFSTFVCAVVMLCFGGFGGKSEDYLCLKYISVCSYDGMLWWYWG